MLALLSILFALGLLSLTVYALHKYQTMEVEFNVDRNMPLPPLTPVGTDHEPKPKPVARASQKKPAGKAIHSKKGITRKIEAKSSSPGSWQDSVVKLKNAGKYAEALQLCRQHFPLWGAYNQLCMLLRTELKSSSLNAAQREERISQLFKTAALAEFLHDKSGDQSRLSNNQLRKLNLEEIERLKFPYIEIGYAHLRLIRKSDIKHMLEFWGRPTTHIRPREFHAQWWQQNVDK